MGQRAWRRARPTARRAGCGTATHVSRRFSRHRVVAHLVSTGTAFPVSPTPLRAVAHLAAATLRKQGVHLPVARGTARPTTAECQDPPARAHALRVNTGMVARVLLHQVVLAEVVRAGAPVVRACIGTVQAAFQHRVAQRAPVALINIGTAVPMHVRACRRRAPRGEVHGIAPRITARCRTLPVARAHVPEVNIGTAVRVCLLHRRHHVPPDSIGTGARV